ncbi:MAG: DUF2071 domain-containing protein [Planctomycetaceae bacterium]|nr:DUF2071 domain-containing protein [Planctomycetaceae bacterium]
MLNYEVDPALLAPRVPPGTELDLFQGKAYVSIVGFMFNEVRFHGWSIPGHRSFSEVNLRFYVQRQQGRELRRGVVFIKEIAPRWWVSAIARRWYYENYVTLPMRHELELADGSISEGGEVTYAWRLRGRWNQCYLRTFGLAELAAGGSLEEFITEHYWGYTRRPDGATLEYQVTHPRWRVWKAAEAHLDCDVADLYGPEFASVLGKSPRSALLAEGSEIAMYRGQPLPATTAG